MKRYIDFQMFDEQSALQFPGIDADILKELEAEMPAPVAEEPAAEQAEEQATEEVKEPEAVPEGEQGTETEETAPADADSDNKQVAGDNQEAPVPYARFKQEYGKRKAIEAELAALKAKMQEQAPPVQMAGPVAAPVQEEVKAESKPDFLKALTAEAIRRAKTRMGISDEDMATLEYGDDLEARTQFQLAVQQESAALMEQARQIAKEREAFERGVAETTGQFTEFVNEFNAMPDAVERWDYIANERFLKLPEQHQAVIKGAFERLQNKRGTPQDYYVAKSYFDMASAEFTASRKPVAPVAPVPVATPVAAPSNTAAKVKAAQALPKAASVGGTAAKPGMSVEDIASILNEPGAAALDKIPPDVLKKIMSGQPIG